MKRIVLASVSPRRAELLASAGVGFDVDAADVDESIRPGELPEPYVRRLAEAKSRAVAERHPESTVLAADTVVVLEGECLGKPRDAGEAAEMLRRLSGQVHEVLTGFTLRKAGRADTGVCRTRVAFRDLTEAEISAYVESGEPMDKAGAYGIQSGAAHMVRRVEGSYSNVVGLPLAEVVESLRGQASRPKSLRN